MTQLERLDSVETILRDALAQLGRLRVEMGGESKRRAHPIAPDATVTMAANVVEVTYTQRAE